jgi:hypothetical protein
MGPSTQLMGAWSKPVLMHIKSAFGVRGRRSVVLALEEVTGASSPLAHNVPTALTGPVYRGCVRQSAV